MDASGEYNNDCTNSMQEGTVFDRLLQYASKLTEKKQMQEHLVHRPVDPATGRRFFKPLTGRKPQTDVSAYFLIFMPHLLENTTFLSCFRFYAYRQDPRQFGLG